MVARHNRECAFYETFVDIEGFPIPKVYFSQKMHADDGRVGMIVMEDLSVNGTNPGPFVSVSIEQVRRSSTMFCDKFELHMSPNYCKPL